MSILFIAISIVFLIAGIAIGACVLCVRGDQFDELDTPSLRIRSEDAEQRAERGQARRSGRLPIAERKH